MPITRKEAAGSYDSTLLVLERAKSGDRSAARILIERALPPLRRWSRGRLPRQARAGVDTEDVVQDAVVNTLKRAGRFEYRTVAGLRAYLRAAVLNRIRDLIRVSWRRGPALELEENLVGVEVSPLERAILREQFQEFLAALQRLRPPDRQAIVWRIELGYSIEEIARRLGKTEGAAAMTVSRALARLAAEMGTKVPP